MLFFPNYCFAAVVLIATNKVEYIENTIALKLPQRLKAACTVSCATVHGGLS